ncbi:MAG: hypothetical protein QXN55_00605 [Candidatus Nitrosotenuis sp.]
MKLWVMIGIVVGLLLVELFYVRHENQARVNQIAKTCNDWRVQTVVYLAGTLTQPIIQESNQLVCVEKEISLMQYYAKSIKR